MSWSRDRLAGGGVPKGRRLVLLAFLGMSLAACGFHPLYGGREQPVLDADLSAIKVEPVPERIGQLLAISLRDSLNPTGARVAPRFVLTIVVATSVSDFAIRSDGTASRQLFAASASFTLRELEGSKVVLTGSARANDSYDVGESPYTSVVDQGNSQKKAAEDMSEQIVTQLALYVRRQAAKS